MKLLITGGSGFLGRYVAGYARAAGIEVTASGRDAADGADVVCDLGDVPGVTRLLQSVRPDVILHLAAVSFVAEQDSELIYRTNLIGSLNLLTALAASGIPTPRLAAASSAAVYGNLEAGPLTESMLPRPANDYGISKLAMEHVFSRWSERTPVILLRLFNTTGRDQSETFVIPKIVGAFRARQGTLQLGSTSTRREYNDVRYIAPLMLQAATTIEQSLTLNICSGRGHSLDEVIDLLQNLTGHSPTIETNPQFLRSNEVQELVGSTDLLYQTLDPQHPAPLADTLRWMLS